MLIGYPSWLSAMGDPDDRFAGCPAVRGANADDASASGRTAPTIRFSRLEGRAVLGELGHGYSSLSMRLGRCAYPQGRVGASYFAPDDPLLLLLDGASARTRVLNADQPVR
jgi:hypothetical protein